MIYIPDKYRKNTPNVNDEYMGLEGTLESKRARLTLLNFLKANIGFTMELLSGVKMHPHQEITIKTMLNRNFSMCIWSRGASKSFCAAMMAIIQSIFEPGSQILIAGPTFRTARFIFDYIEKIVKGRDATLLRQAFSNPPVRRTDICSWKIGDGKIFEFSEIRAIPLSGEKIRGFRANILILDEYLLIPTDIINSVLKPFLVAPQDQANRIRIRRKENDLIARGLMKEEEREKFVNKTKMIALSSASFTFENLYTTYKEWISNIYSEEEIDQTYFVSRLGYEALPPESIDDTIIEEAKKTQGETSSSFLREYCARFVDGADGYFSAKKMHECTVPDGDSPHAMIRGDKDEEYILAIDPNASKSANSDYFAMAVLQTIKGKRDVLLVHGYKKAGGNFKDHIKYVRYLMNNFNICFIIVDNAGADQFIESCNESEYFKNREIHFIEEFDGDKEGSDYEKEIKLLQRQYNRTNGIIALKQVFTSAFIRKANEYLQSCIDNKRIWFASKIQSCPAAVDALASLSANELDLVMHESGIQFAEEQDDVIYQTKRQCALIEVKTSITGHQSFDLPNHLKRDRSIFRARKDNYTVLKLGVWGAKCYYDMTQVPEKPRNSTFAPFIIK